MTDNFIPKKIHYCWFGRNPLPESAQKCIASWRKYQPDYEIIEWNEDNFDVNCIPYTQEAYEAKKYAFVSDYARFKILYEHGGLYFDTDVEVIHDMDDIIAEGPFMGIEKSYASTTDSKGWIGVNAGLGLAATVKMPFYKEVLDFYSNRSFLNETSTVVINVTNLLIPKGLVNKDSLQFVDGITIYPSECFCPMDSTTGILEITPKTISIHHYTCSWLDHNSRQYKIYVLKKKLIKLFGAKLVMKLCELIKR